MKTFNFTSSLKNEMGHFVKLKQSVDSDYNSSTELLFRFDRYLASLSFHATVLTFPIFQNYFETINHLSSKGFSNHYSVLQQFSAWLHQYKTDSYVLKKRMVINRSHSKPAYIFSLDEVKSILETSGCFSQKEELVPGLYKTLFSLLYTTGIRIGEALALHYSDYSNDNNCLYIRKAKFRKQRYLILSNSAANRLHAYIGRYNSITPLHAESPLFVNIRKKPLNYDNMKDAFDKTIKKSSGVKNKKGPSLYSFRHTFAVHRLLQWYKTEEDITVKLPFLSTYMGHVSILSTQHYLQATSELMQEGSQRFHTFFLNQKN